MQPLHDGEPGRFFTWAELQRTSQPLPNVAPAWCRINLRVLVSEVLDPLRVALGRPVRVTSGYRSGPVNAAVKGSPNSKHKDGMAADITVLGMASAELVRFILDLGLPFDQLIAYALKRGGHVHIQVAPRNRQQVLWAPRGGGYETFNRDLLV